MLTLKKSLFDFKLVFTPTIFHSKNPTKKSIDLQNKSAYYRANSKILDYAKNNIFNYFFTCTIDDNKANINDINLIKKRILKHFNNIKNRFDSDFKFILVHELGKKNNRLHFHGLIYLNNTINLKHIGRGIYRDEWFYKNFGANNWQKIKEYNIKCANYITKYIVKSDNKLYSSNYWCSRGLKESVTLARINCDLSIESVYQKQLDFMFAFLSEKGLVIDYAFCSVCCVDKKLFNELLINYMYNPDFEKGFKQLCFSDLKGGVLNV